MYKHSYIVKHSLFSILNYCRIKAANIRINTVLVER